MRRRKYVIPHRYVGRWSSDRLLPRDQLVCVHCDRHLLDYVHTPGARQAYAARVERAAR